MHDVDDGPRKEMDTGPKDRKSEIVNRLSQILEHLENGQGPSTEGATCPSCNLDLEKDWVMCPECGFDLST